MTATHASTADPTADLIAHVDRYLAAFGTASVDALDQLYEPHALVIAAPGHPMAGAQRGIALKHLLGFGVPIEATVRHVYAVDDVALLIVDWRLEGPGPDGRPIKLAGTATDVARRGADGRWRYLIDNPFGTAEPAGPGH